MCVYVCLTGAALRRWMATLHIYVWTMVVLCGLVVGIAYTYIEHGVDGSDLDRQGLLANGAASIISALLLFTGGGGQVRVRVG